MNGPVKKNRRYVVGWSRFYKDYSASKDYQKTFRNLDDAKKFAEWIESHKRTCSVQITHWWDGYMCSNFWEVIKPAWKKACEI